LVGVLLDDLIEPARVRKHWNKHDERWAVAADVSLKTLQRFWSQTAIRRANFIAICQAIEIEDWKEIADLTLQRQPNHQLRSSANLIPSGESNISLNIEGSTSAPLGKITYYTITSQNAIRGVWSVGGFQNEPIEVTPLGPSHQIFIEPTDATRVGETFTIGFTAYDASDRSVSAMKRFTVVSDVKDISVPIPNIYELPYETARKRLIEAGWQPYMKHWSYSKSPNVQSGNGSVFWQRGYHEIDSCSPTGYGSCRFDFRDV
jgi:hypothetical protein